MSVASVAEFDPTPHTRESALAALAKERERSAQLEREVKDLKRWKYLVKQALGNKWLQPAERITAVFSVIAYEKEQQKGIVSPNGEYPVCKAYVSKTSGQSVDTVRRHMDTLQTFGFCKLRTDEPEPVMKEKEDGTRERGVERTSYLRLTAPTPFDALEQLATIKPDREKLLKKKKPGGLPSEHMVRDAAGKFRGVCPHCKAKGTLVKKWTIICTECGVPVDEGQDNIPYEPEDPMPQVAAQIEEYDAASCGYPPPVDSEETTGLVQMAARDTDPAPMPQLAALEETTDTAEPAKGSELGRDAAPPKKPCYLPVNPDGVAPELKRWRQWVCWRAEFRDGRWTKIPLDPCTGQRAKVDDPGTWGTFDQALARYCGTGLDGIGYVFTADDPYAGVDLDALDENTQHVECALHSYTEQSPSGRGRHILIEASKPGQRCRSGPIEVYDQGRWFAMTGHRIEARPPTIEPRQKELSGLYSRLFPEKTETLARPIPVRVQSDEVVLKKMLNSKRGSNISALWEGRWQPLGYPSQSEADAALSTHLRYWTGGDEAQMDRLFRQSGLYRGKWDRATGSRGTYGEVTIQQALRQ